MNFILNFHGIGNAKRPYEDGEEPYWISEEQFFATLDLVGSSKQPVAITFDDGNDSDYYTSVPELRARGLAATFFVLAGKLNQPGYLSPAQVSEIDADPLFSIGSHGVNHYAWTDLDDAELQKEIVGAQQVLSDVCGRKVEQVGLPFGRYDRRVMRALETSGHDTVYSSDGMPRLRSANPVPRFSIRKDTKMGSLARMIANQRSFVARLNSEVRSTWKALR